MKMEITGKAGAYQAATSPRVSRRRGMARKTIALHAITDLTKGTTLNVGFVSGGRP